MFNFEELEQQENIFIKEGADQKLRKLVEGGAENLHILSDFDRTLTYGTYEGEKTPSLISILRKQKYLTPDYPEKAYELFDHYHPIEIDPDIPLDEKKREMVGWWHKHNELLINSGLTENELREIATSGKLKFRDGVKEVLRELYQNQIPLVILSAAAAGNSVQYYFESEGVDYGNIDFVTNQFIWDDKGNAVDHTEPVIHPFNKDETVLKEIPEVYEKIKDRENVLLLGDGLGDLGMIEGFEYDELLTIGFLNYDIENHREQFREKFDIVIEGDGDFHAVSKVINKITHNT